MLEKKEKTLNRIFIRHEKLKRVFFIRPKTKDDKLNSMNTDMTSLTECANLSVSPKAIETNLF